MKCAVLVVYSKKYDAYLCISRKSGLYGFPGGKEDIGDLNVKCTMVREILEELAIRCYTDEIKYHGFIVSEDKNSEIYIYTPNKLLSDIILFRYDSPNMTTPEKQTTDFLSVESLCDKNISEFYKENIKILELLLKK